MQFTFLLNKYILILLYINKKKLFNNFVIINMKFLITMNNYIKYNRKTF